MEIPPAWRAMCQISPSTRLNVAGRVRAASDGSGAELAMASEVTCMIKKQSEAK